MFYFRFPAAVVIGLLLVQTAYAQNNVVVIPLWGDDVAMAQQNFRYKGRVNVTGNRAFMCETDVFNTPNQETQVLLIANANARFTVDSSYWYINIQVSKDSGTFTSIDGVLSEAFNEARSDAWSQISTTDILDLEPNSSYQFRIDLNATESTGEFSGSFTDYCELVVSATYKLPQGKSILEVL